AGLLYKEMAGTVLGSIKVAIPIGGILVPFLMSTLIRLSSFEVSLILFPLSVLLAFLLIYFVSPGRSKVRQSSSLD
ncbi:MAG: hypothetical protein JSV69_14300, partial [Chloroflexota bacterium]